MYFGLINPPCSEKIYTLEWLVTGNMSQTFPLDNLQIATEAQCQITNGAEFVIIEMIINYF